MARSFSAATSDLSRQMAQAYAINDRMNQLLLDYLDVRAWRAKTPGHRGRTIAAIFSHVHNIRCKWLRLSAPHLALPVRLDRTRCTQKQVSIALAESAARCCEMVAESMSGSPKVKSFVRDGWSSPWVPGPAMLGYMICHDAHHRGQICMLAHQLGFPLPVQAGAGMWAWERLAKDRGSNSLKSQALGPLLKRVNRKR